MAQRKMIVYPGKKHNGRIKERNGRSPYLFNAFLRHAQNRLPGLLPVEDQIKTAA